MSGLKILAPLDHSSRDRILFPQLQRMSVATGASIHVLHVVPLIRTLTLQGVHEAESYVDAVVKQLAARGVDAHGLVRKGDPASEIAKVASEYEVDGIVMTTRGRRGLDRLTLGSVAENVISHCAVPVTLINEATARGALDERTWAQSSYMAGIVWNRVARGLLTEDQAVLELQRLEAMGLDQTILENTYASLQQAGAPAGWLDLDFQLDTLHEFMPSVLHEDSSAA